MKIRQILKNFFQNLVEKHQDDFVKDQQEETTKPAEQAKLATEEYTIDDQFFEEDLKKIAQGAATNGTGNNSINSSSANGTPFYNGNSNSPTANFNNGNIPANGTGNLPPSGNDFNFAEGATTHNVGNFANSPFNASDFDVDTESINVGSIEQSAANKKGRKQKFYTFTPRKSKAREAAIERTANKKKRAGSIKIKIEKKAQIVRQLSVLLEAGMDLCSSLAILEEQEVHNREIWFFIHDLFTKIEAGDTFSDALMNAMVKFDESEIAMVRAGEAIGQQGETLAKMANLMEKKVLIKKKITSAMFYPAMVLIVSSVVVLLLTTLVVPKFEKVISDQLGADAMPALTKFIVDCSHFVSSHLVEVLILLGTIFFLFVIAKTVTSVKKLIYGVLLKMPLLGNCIVTWCVVLFSRTFGDLLVCGCSIVESLKMARESIGNYFMRESLAGTINDVQQGMTLSDSLRRRSVFPAMAEGLIKVGEESGKLGEMMNRVSASYEEQLDEFITRLTSLLEPILVIFLAGFVGTVVIGLFMPLVSLIQNISA